MYSTNRMELICNYEVNKNDDKTERIITETWTVSRGWWKGKKSKKEEKMMRNVTKNVNENKNRKANETKFKIIKKKKEIKNHAEIYRENARNK